MCGVSREFWDHYQCPSKSTKSATFTDNDEKWLHELKISIEKVEV